MRFIVTVLVLTIGSLCTSPVLNASENSLEELLVISSRVPQSLKQLSTSVTLLTAEDIQAHGNLSLTDVLRQSPGIATSNNGGSGQITILRIRGEEGFRTLTMLDGIRLADPSSTQITPQLEHMLSSGIGRVEILRGPQGLAYGADAGGVVNMSTRQVRSGLQAGLDVQSGKYDTEQVVASVGGAGEQGDFFISATQVSSGGFNSQTSDTVLMDDDAYDNRSVHARGSWQLNDVVRVQAVHRQVDGDTEYDACWAGTTVHDCLSEYQLHASRLSLDYQGRVTSHQLSYALTETDRENFSAGQSAFTARGRLKRLEYQGSATGLNGFDLVWGLDLEEAILAGDGRTNKGMYLEYLSDFAPALHINIGVRHDDNEDFGSHSTYRLSSAYLHEFDSGNALKVKSSYGTGFRAPSPYEISYNRGPWAYAPASLYSLQEERSRGWEAGLEFFGSDDLYVEAVYFDQQVDNAIIFDLSGFSGYLQDIGTSHSKGIEFSTRVALNASLQLQLNHTWNKTEQANGQRRLRRPEHLSNVGLSWQGFSQALQLNAFLRSSRDASDSVAGNTVQLDDFAVLDITARYRVSKHLQIYGRAENALDERYQEIAAYNTAGRALYVGFNFALQR